MSESPKSAKIYAFPGKGSRENLDNKNFMELDGDRLKALEDFLSGFPPTSEEIMERTHRAIGPLSKEYLIGAINSFSPDQTKDIEAKIAVYRAFVEQLTQPEKVAALFARY